MGLGKMNLPTIPSIEVGPLGGAVVSAIVSYFIFVWLSRRRDQRSKALELLTKFMMDEYYVKARLVSQEYLVPFGKKYHICKGLNFEEINLTA